VTALLKMIRTTDVVNSYLLAEIKRSPGDYVLGRGAFKLLSSIEAFIYTSAICCRRKEISVMAPYIVTKSLTGKNIPSLLCSQLSHRYL
jgi:hypothetical protein